MSGLTGAPGHLQRGLLCRGSEQIEPYIVWPRPGKGEARHVSLYPKTQKQGSACPGAPPSMIPQQSMGTEDMMRGEKPCYSPATASAPRKGERQRASQDQEGGEGLGTGFHLSAPSCWVKTSLSTGGEPGSCSVSGSCQETAQPSPGFRER